VLRAGRLPVSEHSDQCALFNWLAYIANQRPEARLAFHVPNGGARDAVTGAQLRAAGVKAGVPDVCLPVARHGWHGLFIELKVKQRAPRPNQVSWLDALTEQGYLAVLCDGWLDAKDVIAEYLSLDGAPPTGRVAGEQAL